MYVYMYIYICVSLSYIYIYTYIYVYTCTFQKGIKYLWFLRPTYAITWRKAVESLKLGESQKAQESILRKVGASGTQPS